MFEGLVSLLPILKNLALTSPNVEWSYPNSKQYFSSILIIVLKT
jgi:hypothetical protein